MAAAAEAPSTLGVSGSDGWFYLSAELRHLEAGEFWGSKAAAVSRATKPEYADPLPAILDFHAQLAKAGVELIVVPVPAKATIYPEHLPDDFQGLEKGGATDDAFLDVLRAEGVKVVKLAPVFAANRGHAEGPLYCLTDSHWSGVGCVVAAQEIAKSLPEAGAGSSPYESEWQRVEISGDLGAGLRETLRVRKVGRKGPGGLEAIAADEKSPVVLLGDSHNLVFHAGGDMFARGAGLADQLALELGFPLDVVAVRGSGATPARINLLRRAQKNSAYWKGKKCVIWCFSVREFTESDGWRKVPISSAVP